MRIALEHAGISVGEMAETLGCDRNTVGNYMAGRTVPRLPTLRVWAMRTGVPLDWLRYGIEPATGDDGGPTLGGTTTACNAHTHRPHATILPLRIAA